MDDVDGSDASECELEVEGREMVPSGSEGFAPVTEFVNSSSAPIAVTEEVLLKENGDPSQSDSASALIGVCERIVSGAAAEVTETLRAESMSPRVVPSKMSPRQSEQQEAAAVKMQSVHRGRQARKVAHKKKEEKSRSKVRVETMETELVSSPKPVPFTKSRTEPAAERKAANSKSSLLVPPVSPRAQRFGPSLTSPRSPRSSSKGTSRASKAGKSESEGASRASKSEPEVSLRNILLQSEPADVEGTPEDFPLDKDLGASKVKKLLEHVDKLMKPTKAAAEACKKTAISCDELVLKAEELLESQPPESILQMQEDAYAALDELRSYTHQVQDDISATTDKNEHTKTQMDAVAREFRQMRAALRKNREQLKKMQDDIEGLQNNTCQAMTESIEQLKDRTRRIMNSLGEETKSTARSQRSQVEGRSRSSIGVPNTIEREGSGARKRSRRRR